MAPKAEREGNISNVMNERKKYSSCVMKKDATKERCDDKVVNSMKSLKSEIEGLLPWLGILVWPSMLTVPLVLSSEYSFTSYQDLFYPDEYEFDSRPKPLGLCLGIFAVAVGQVFVLCYFYLHRNGFFFTNPPSIQVKGPPDYKFIEGMKTHFSQPEGFVLLVGYLCITWMFRLMPPSYYSFDGSIQWIHLIGCLVVQDGIQFFMHFCEHSISMEFYRKSHKPHHRFTNPRLFDAFNGSLGDTIVMILIPLYSTALLIPGCNVWTYMAFGSTYANWLVLIHSEYPFPWDKLFRSLGLGTPGDHHVHHKFFKYNYGHLFLWFDRLCGTYRNPEGFKAFHPDV